MLGLAVLLTLTMMPHVVHAALSAAPPASEPQVLVVYYSRTGHTRAMADAVARGAREAGARVSVLSVADATPQDVLAADAIVLGSPVHNGNPAPELLSFINTWPFAGAPLKDRLGAAFATGGGTSSGEEAVLHSLHRSLLMFGMIIVGGDDWHSAFGASAITEEWPMATDGGVAPHFLARGEALGCRIGSAASRWMGSNEHQDCQNSNHDAKAD